MKGCSIPQYISNKTTDIKEAERLADIDFDIREELVQSKLFVRKDGLLLIPKNGYAAALSKIANINKRFTFNPISLGKREIGEVIKVDISKELENTLYSIVDKKEIDEDLINNLTGFVKKINPDFKIEVLNDLLTKRGVYGLANIKDFVISLQEGSEGNLPEEVAHFFVELLPTDSKLFSQMNDEIVRTKLYKDVVGKYNKVYKGDTQRLKNEAMAQLISLYLTDKEQFRRMSGSPSLVENLIRWIKEFFGFIKTNSHVGSFIIAANDIVNQDISKIDVLKEIEFEEMFAISPSDINALTADYNKKLTTNNSVFQSLDNADVSKYSKVYLNLNDTIFDANQYYNTTGVAKKKFLAGEGAENEAYVTNAKLTPLGEELAHKKHVLGRKFFIYTSSYISDALRTRIKSEFALSDDEVDEVLISSRPTREVELPGGKLGTETVENNLFERLKSTKERSLLIDNKAVDITNMAVTRRTYSVDNSSFTTLFDSYMVELRRLEREIEAQEMEDAFGQLGFKKLGEEIQQFVKKIANEEKNLKVFESIVSKLPENELKNMLTDSLGRQSFPTRANSQLLKSAALLNAENFGSTVRAFTALIDFTNNHFQKEVEDLKSDNGRVRKMIEGDNLSLAIYDLNKMIGTAASWKRHIQILFKGLEKTENTTIVKRMFETMLGNINDLESIATSTAVEVVSKHLITYFDGYNANRGALIKEFEERLEKNTSPGIFGGTNQLSEKEKLKIQETLVELRNNPGVTSEHLADILLGKAEDVNPISLWTRTLINSPDPLVYAIDSLIQRGQFAGNLESIKEIQLEMGSITDEMEKQGIKDEDLAKIVFVDKQLVWDKKEGKKTPKPRLALLNPFQNTYRMEEEEQKINTLEKELREIQNTGTRQQIETKEAEVKLAKEAHFNWKLENWNQRHSPAYYRRFDVLKAEYGDIYNEALLAYSSTYSQLDLLEKRFMDSDNIEEEKYISREIDRIVVEQRRLKSPYNTDGSLKDEKGRLIAEVLVKKGDIDKEFFTSDINHVQFKKDLLRWTSGITLRPKFEALMNVYLDTQNYGKLIALLRTLGNRDLDKKLDIHTKTIFTPEFYEARKILVDNIAEVSNRLNEIRGIDRTNIKELWEKILTMSSPYRDKDGVINGDILTLSEQEIVRDYEQEVENIKQQAEDMLEVSGNVISKEEKDLGKELSELFKQLTELQSKRNTQTYTDIFLEKMMDATGGESFSDLFNTGRNMQIGYGSSPKSLLDNSEFLKFIDKNPDLAFSIWFKSNHLIKRSRLPGQLDIMNRYIPGDFIEKFVPIYVWNRITPNNAEHISAALTNKYSKREVVKEHTTEKNEYTWNESNRSWLPLRKRGEFWNDTWHKLNSTNGSKDKKLSSLLKDFTAFHFKSQEDAPMQGKIGWFLNSVQRHTVDGTNVVNSINDFFDKSNRFEEGEANNPALESEEIEKKGWFNKVKGLFERGVMDKFINVDDSDYTGKDKVPVPFSGWASPEDVSSNLVVVLSMYRGSTKAAKHMLNAVPVTNLSLKVLTRDTIEFDNNDRLIQNKKKGVSVNENRAKQVGFIRKNRLMGFNKEYELGKGVDNFALAIRKVNSFGSLSDLTGIVNNIKNGLAGRLQNAIQADFVNWSSNRSMIRAAAYKNNNFFWFLNQAEKKDKDVDWYIQSFFNPGASAEITTMGLKDAKKRFYKTHAGFYSSAILEYPVASNLLYAHLFHKQVEKVTLDNNGKVVSKEVKNLHEIFTVVEGELRVKEGYVDSRTGRIINMDYVMDVRKIYKSMLENVNGKIQQKTMLSTTTLGQMVLYFKNWLIPMFRRRFDLERSNFALEEDVEGYWITMVKFLANSIKEKQLMYGNLNDMQQRNVRIAMKEVAALIAFGLLISVVGGFDYDDPDRFKKLRDNPYLANLALQLAIQVQSETEALSVSPIYNVGGGWVPPVFQEGVKLVEKPWVGWNNVKSALKAIDGLYGMKQYDKDMPAYNIEEGEYKSWHYIKKTMQLDDLEYIGNPEGKIQVFTNTLKQ